MYDRIMPFTRATPRYTYEGLLDRQFRLVEILPHRSSIFGGRLQSHIKIVSLDDPDRPDYQAISYVWGDPTPSKKIQVNGSLLALPVNSERALRRMALPNRKRLVYLDAVCINQADVDERGKQVMLMADIYRNASRTLIWIGDATKTTKRAFENLELLSREVAEDTGPDRSLMDLVGVGKSSFQSSQAPPRTGIDREALNDLFGRPWFRRAWVVQEVAVARRSLLVCGSLELDMDLVLGVGVWLRLYHANHIDAQMGRGLWSTNVIANDRLHLARWGGTLMSEILKHGRGLEATDPRDKVFSMLGLLRPGPLSEPIIPDYTLPVSEVLQDAVKQTLRFSLSVLSEISHRTEADLSEEGFPSWTPRFDRPEDHDLDSQALFSHDGRNVFGDRERYADVADGQTIPPDVIILSGLVIGHVLEVSETLENEVFARETTTLGPLADWHAGVRRMLAQRKLSETLLKRTLIADTNDVLQKSSPSDLADYDCILPCLQQRLTAQEFVTSREPSIQQAFRYHQAMFKPSSNRKVAILSNETIGLVPRVTQSSDLIAAMHGALSPFVLRQHGDDFLLIGECYIDGYMRWQEHGEQMERRMWDETPQLFRVR